jgi:hypothetical protein
MLTVPSSAFQQTTTPQKHQRPPTSLHNNQNQADGALRCEVVAHSRSLSALALHPRRDVFATAAEDATVAVWTLPTPVLPSVPPPAPPSSSDNGSGVKGFFNSLGLGGGGSSGGSGGSGGKQQQHSVRPLLSACELGAMLTGVAFCGEGEEDLAAVGYDVDELVVWRRVVGAVAGDGC